MIERYLLRIYLANPLISEVDFRPGGDDGIRTHDPLLAGQVLSQLSYTPIFKWFAVVFFTVFCSIKEAVTLPLLMSALSYLPVRSPAKYFNHCRA